MPLLLRYSAQQSRVGGARKATPAPPTGNAPAPPPAAADPPVPAPAAAAAAAAAAGFVAEPTLLRSPCWPRPLRSDAVLPRACPSTPAVPHDREAAAVGAKWGVRMPHMLRVLSHKLVRHVPSEERSGRGRGAKVEVGVLGSWLVRPMGEAAGGNAVVAMSTIPTCMVLAVHHAMS
eukprot:641636-Pelagomonas_calceolata.AAC.1